MLEGLAVAGGSGRVSGSVSMRHISSKLIRRIGEACPSWSWAPRPACGPRRLGHLGRVLAQLLHLIAHLLDLAPQELLLELSDLLGTLGADEPSREVEGYENVCSVLQTPTGPLHPTARPPKTQTKVFRGNADSGS